MVLVTENFIPLITFAAFVIIFTWIVKWYVKNAERWMLINSIPGIKSYPLIGTSYIFFGVHRNDLFKVQQKEAFQYPYISRSWIGPRPEIGIRKAEYVEKVISSSKNLDKSLGYRFLQPWLGNGLLLSSGSHWHKRRKILTPTFHYGILENFCDVFSEKSDILVKKLMKHAENGDTFDIYNYITNAALDIICETAMGIKVNAQEANKSEYVESVYLISELVVKRVLRFWLHSDFIYKLTRDGRKYNKCLKVLHKYTRHVIEKRKVMRNVVGKRSLFTRYGFLDLLLDEHENNNQLSVKDICEEVDTFMFEGHDTTTSGISWTLYLVGLHNDVQNKIFEELDGIFHGSDRSTTLSDLNEMKYLERVIKESMRLYPPVPRVGRLLSEDLQLDEYKIPKGCAVSIQMYYIHRDERFFPNPEEFNPDRFLPENTVGRHPYAYLPFSAGPRNCIGQKFAMYEEKSILSAIFKNFKVKSIKQRNDVRAAQELILRPIDGIIVSIEKRV